jgi:chromosome segregation protein
MHLQYLELFGFKSFADKTTFNFHEGITAIVGPNGCGKSNLLDAMRWVLGEQSAKSLRGGEMADVIFNGTDTRKPLGFAEVSLTLTDCAAELGVDWHEVRVSRRVYRDGNSEYFLNKTLCRLRDIQNLFADTGVARSAYSMMEQGKIDLILSSRPEDRRAVFEEAAGITKYKAQKREALRKLEATEANLLRIGDIIKEVKRQIGSLQRQAGKARRYQVLLADLQVLDTHHSRKQLEELERELINCRSEIKRISEEEGSTRRKIDDREAELAESRRSLDQIDAEIAEGRAEIERLQSEISGHRSRIEFNRQRADEITELVARSKREIAAAEAKREQQQTQMKEVSALLEKTVQLLQTKRSELAQLTELTSKLRTDRAASEAELQALQLSSSKIESRVSVLEDDISGITIRREATSEHLRDLDSAISEARSASEKAESALAATRATTEGERKNVDVLLAEAQAAEKTLQQQRQLLAEREKSLIAIERALAEKESRLEVLKQLNEEGEGLAQGSQAVLKGLDDPARIRSALAGALVAQLEVDPKFVSAIEAALGRNLHTIVLQNGDVVPEIFATLTKKKLGQTALYVPELAQSSLPQKQNTLPEGALAFAEEKVNAPESLQPLVQRLLHDVVIFADLDRAIHFKKASPELSVATLAGEFISSEGIVFGGSNGAQNESLLERKGRISILTAEYSMLTAQRGTLRQKRDEAKTALEKAEGLLEESRSKHRAADLAQFALGNTIAILERESGDAARKVDNLLSEKTTLIQQIQAADGRVAELEKELATVRTEIADQQHRQEATESARKAAVAEEEKATEQLNDLRLALATEQQRYDNLVAQQQPMTAREAELVETIESRQADIANFEKRLMEQADESKFAEAAIDGGNTQREKQKAALNARMEKRTESSSALNAAETELRDVRNSLNELHDRRSSQQVRESQLQMKIDNLADNIQRRYHVDLRNFAPDQAFFSKTLNVQLKRRDKVEGGAPATPSEGSKDLAVDPDIADVEKIIADLTQQLDNMGPVNLDAVHEYDELEERYKFLDTQNNDLTTSRRELLDVISRINSTTQKLFAETFAQVRLNFREMFAELFGGGRADLSLLDENDPLNCGIEISAKPPGKQLQTISLLSGGERTMTAVALLFAIYMVRPSPFCVLDEMDAALDETNINRFIRVLERFVEQSQFVIITHNKRTIAKADVIYGVTMEERGVSKLVGMKLTERPEATPDRAPESLAGIGTQRHFALEGAEHEHEHSLAGAH